MKRRALHALRVLLGALASLCAAVTLLALLIDGAGTSPRLMLSLMERYAPPETTALDADSYDDAAVMICGYLAGSVEEFQLQASVGGEEPGDVFQPHEQAHMADCRSLFVLDRTVALLGAAAVVALGLGLFFLRGGDKAGLRGMCWGLRLLLAVLLGLIVWGLVDFDGLFVTFHKLAFTNDLWLLDPRTDMLIRLMPIGFFIHYGALLGGTWPAALVGIEVVCEVLTHQRRSARA